MVADGDERAFPEAGVDAPGGVGDDEFVAAKHAEDSGGVSNLGEWVALVGMDAALHNGDDNPADGADDKFAAVAFHGGERPAGDFVVGNDGRIFDLRGEVTEAG